jgi:transposase
MDQPAACCPNCGDGTKLLDAGRVKVMEARGEVLKQRLQCLSCKDTFLVEGKVAAVTAERLRTP